MVVSDPETLALKALAYLAAEGEPLMRFVGVSGIEAQDLRARAADAELLAAVMDFLLSDDALTQAFAEAQGIDAALLHAVRRALPGASEG